MLTSVPKEVGTADALPSKAHPAPFTIVQAWSCIAHCAFPSLRAGALPSGGIARAVPAASHHAAGAQLCGNAYGLACCSHGRLLGQQSNIDAFVVVCKLVARQRLSMIVSRAESPLYSKLSIALVLLHLLTLVLFLFACLLLHPQLMLDPAALLCQRLLFSLEALKRSHFN